MGIKIKSTLLVANKTNETSMNFYWFLTLRNNFETVDVIVFNCDSKDEFKSLLEKDLNILEKIREKRSDSLTSIENQISFIKNTLIEMSDQIFVKKPSEDLLNVLSAHIKKKLTTDDVIYLSGVA